MKKIKKPKDVKLDNDITLKIYENNFLIHYGIVGIHFSKKNALKLAMFFDEAVEYFIQEKKEHMKAKKTK